MKSRKYYGINIAIFLITIGIFIRISKEGFAWLSIQADIIPIFFLSLVSILIVHSIKALRLYFIMLETRLTITRFLRVYVKTTCVNLVLPFKLGEFFRMYCLGHELKNFKTGILLILVDRYFDTIPLVILILGFTLLGQGVLKGVVIILIGFLVVVTIAYAIFPSTFAYMNRFLIISTNSEHGLMSLELLKKMRYWYFYIQNLIKGRELILLILSSLSWAMEYVALYSLIKGLGHMFSVADFIAYMDSVFIGSISEYIKLYIGISAAILSGIATVVYGKSFVLRKRK